MDLRAAIETGIGSESTPPSKKETLKVALAFLNLSEKKPQSYNSRTALGDLFRAAGIHV